MNASVTRRSKPITVTLGDLRDRVEARVRSGAYTSASDVVRAGLRALDREEAALEAVIRQRVQEALDNREPPLTHEQVFGELRAHHAKRMKAAKREV